MQSINTNKIKKTIFYLIVNLTLLFLISSCASVINTTGSLDSRPEIEHLTIYCNTPDNVSKFSTALCQNLKMSLKKSGINTYVELINEMQPVLKSDSIKKLDRNHFIMKISHIRVSLYNGQPCNTLMSISITNDEKKSPIWAARIYTKGSNITGPGNPEKVSAEILTKMKADGVIKPNE